LEPLFNSLQINIRFFIHPLPSKEFGLCYLGLTRSIRPLLDSVGLTLLYHLVLHSLLDAVYSAMEVLFTRILNCPFKNTFPFCLLARAYQPYLALFPITQFKQQFTFVHHKRTPLSLKTTLG
jgi:hypothetical protein